MYCYFNEAVNLNPEQNEDLKRKHQRSMVCKKPDAVSTELGAVECPFGYEVISSSESCRAACLEIGFASNVHGDRDSQWQYQKGCIATTAYCYHNEGVNPNLEQNDDLKWKHQRSMVCKKPEVVSTEQGAVDCPAGYEVISSSESCRAACLELGYASNVHGDRESQWQDQQGCIATTMYCYFNEAVNSNPEQNEDLKWKHQRSMVCKKPDAVSTERGAVECPFGYEVISSSESCRAACLELGFDSNVHGDRDSQWQYQQGCIGTTAYCYFNEAVNPNPEQNEDLKSKHQRYMVCAHFLADLRRRSDLGHGNELAAP